MSKAETVSPKAFVDAWRDVVESMSVSETEEFVKDFYHSNREHSIWTRQMLTGEHAFLKRVADKLDYSFADKDREGKICLLEPYFCIDMVLKNSNHPGLGFAYPMLLDVAIEHENGAHPENEMWKLIFVRAPLKVLVYYGHDGDGKIGKMLEMLRMANSEFPENEDTHYLFFLGQMGDGYDHLEWVVTHQQSCTIRHHSTPGAYSSQK